MPPSPLLHAHVKTDLCACRERTGRYTPFCVEPACTGALPRSVSLGHICGKCGRLPDNRHHLRASGPRHTSQRGMEIVPNGWPLRRLHHLLNLHARKLPAFSEPQHTAAGSVRCAILIRRADMRIRRIPCSTDCLRCAFQQKLAWCLACDFLEHAAKVLRVLEAETVSSLGYRVTGGEFIFGLLHHKTAY